MAAVGLRGRVTVHHLRRFSFTTRAGESDARKGDRQMTWWHRFLLDPSRLTLELARWWPLAAAVAALAAVAWLAAWVQRSRARAEAVRSARWVVIHPPAMTRPEDSVWFWQSLARLLRRRRRGWTPHVVFEFAWAGQDLTLAVWVPGLVAAGQVAQITETAWPGASAQIRPSPPPVLPPGVTAAGGELTASGGRDWLPLRTDHQADPLRAVFAFGLCLGAGDRVMVQVAARLASPSRQARARAGAQGKRAGTGGAGGLLLAVVRTLVLGALDLITGLMRPGPSSASSQRAPSGPAAREQQRDPFSQAQQRSAVRKLTSPPLWEVAVRYTVASTAGQAARGRVLAHRDVLSAAFGAFTGDLELADRPARDPAGTLAGRPLRRGFVADTAELAALAHLPYEPATVPGLRPSGARPVPPPPHVRRVPPWSGQ
jgi:hypothetical protein